jgi:hypothetical protein
MCGRPRKKGNHEEVGLGRYGGSWLGESMKGACLVGGRRGGRQVGSGDEGRWLGWVLGATTCAQARSASCPSAHRIGRRTRTGS